METFYQDKDSYFKCRVEIDGASLEESKARLVLKFNDSMSYLFESKIDGDGKCKIKVPALKNMSDANGSLVLEVIADSTFFEPFTSNFIVKKSKNVVVIKEDEEKDELITSKPKVNIIREEKSLPVSFSDYYKVFTANKLHETIEYKNYTPSQKALSILNESKLNKDSEVYNILAYWVDVCE